MTAHHVDVVSAAERSAWQAVCTCGWEGHRRAVRMRAEIDASEHQLAGMADEGQHLG